MFNLDTLFAIGTIVLQLVTLLLLVLLFVKENKFSLFVKKYFLQIGFFTTLVSVLVSLTYSTVFGYAPCLLCWWARIFMFPQLILFGVAWWKKTNPTWEIFLLSLLGVLFSGYHVYIELGGNEIISCETGGVSCLKRYVFEFGYITIPVMALTGFIFLTLLAAHNLKKK
jgi:disulfide bond formation protein DsbB